MWPVPPLSFLAIANHAAKHTLCCSTSHTLMLPILRTGSREEAGYHHSISETSRSSNTEVTATHPLTQLPPSMKYVTWVTHISTSSHPASSLHEVCDLSHPYIQNSASHSDSQFIFLRTCHVLSLPISHLSNFIHVRPQDQKLTNYTWYIIYILLNSGID